MKISPFLFSKKYFLGNQKNVCETFLGNNKTVINHTENFRPFRFAFFYTKTYNNN